MKRYIIGLLVVGIGLSACQNNTKEFTIDGEVENAGTVKKVLLYEADQLIDSAFLNEKSKFVFKRVSPDAQFYTMMIGEKNFMVIAKNGDKIEFEADLTDSTGSYKIDGSEESKGIKEFHTISAKYRKIYQAIENEYNERIQRNPADKEAIVNELTPKFQGNVEAYSNEVIGFAEKNKDNLAGFYAIGTIDQQKYEEQLIKYADEIATKFPSNKPVQAFVAKMKSAKVIAVGQPAPQFTLNNPQGKPVSLSDFKGKYVLLDFWASWCGPCRQENPNVVVQYNAFKNKNFTVLGISLDDNKDAWLKAIADDKLAWTHVSELKRWDGKVSQEYKIEGIPASFLLDPTGKIVAKNLRGKDLEDFLKSKLN